MGKKIQSEMDAQRATFVEGARKNDVEDARASMIFDKVAKFAGYGFNKCHSAPYALVAYQTAYLKANYPVEFFAASMTLDMGNADKIGNFRRELERLQIPLLPPDVNRSMAEFAVETTAEGKKAVRYALAAIKGVGRDAMARLAEEREANGPFKDLFDFAERLDQRVINKRLLESLVKAGAFDSLNKNRAQTFGAVEALTRHSQATHESRGSNQNSLFGDDTAQRRPQLPKVPDWAPMERLQNEFAAIGFYLSSHPLAAYERSLQRLGVMPRRRPARRCWRAARRAASSSPAPSSTGRSAPRPRATASPSCSAPTSRAPSSSPCSASFWAASAISWSRGRRCWSRPMAGSTASR